MSKITTYPTKNIELDALEQDIRNLQAQLSQAQATIQRLKTEFMQLAHDGDSKDEEILKLKAVIQRLRPSDSKGY